MTEKILEDVGIACNKNAIPYDPHPPKITSGLRFGTAAATSRGFNEDDFKNVGALLQNYNFDVKYNVSTDGDMPTIIIEERETNQRLIQFRAMYQNKRKANGQKYLYFRNYVEKGAFLKELIGTSALNNNVTST